MQGNSQTIVFPSALKTKSAAIFEKQIDHEILICLGS